MNVHVYDRVQDLGLLVYHITTKAKPISKKGKNLWSEAIEGVLLLWEAKEAVLVFATSMRGQTVVIDTTEQTLKMMMEDL